MGETAIAWCDFTHNQWLGCDEVGPGCDHCYARELDRRYQWGVPAAERVAGAAPHWGVDAPRHLTSEANRRKPLAWNAAAEAAGKPALVFAHSLSDVFDKRVPQDWREGLYRTWRATPWLRWIVVTKRIGLADDMLPEDFAAAYPNVGIVATVCNQVEVDRDVWKLIVLKRKRGVTWVGLSVEPQLGHVDLTRVRFPDGGREHYFNALTGEVFLRGKGVDGFPDLTVKLDNPWPGLDWVIGGGESLQPSHAPDKPPRIYNVAWGRALIKECGLAGVAYFQKQLGARPLEIVEQSSDVTLMPLRDRRAGADPAEWPTDLRIQNFPEALMR